MATPGRGPGRPRGPEDAGRRAVMRAVRAELTEVGFADFNVERVATRAGVHKSTLYKHWGNRSGLVRHALAGWRQGDPAVDTGTWDGDLRVFCRAMATTLEQSATARAVVRTMVVAQTIDPELSAELAALNRMNDAAITAVVQRAQARGEVDPDIDPALVIELVMGPLILRTAVLALPIDDAYVDSLTRAVLAATTPRPTDTP